MNIRQHSFFFYFSLVLIFIVIAGFSLFNLLNPEGPVTMSWLLYTHAAIFFAWYLLLTFQTSLIAKGNVKLHQKLGISSIVLAVLILITAYLVTQVAVLRPNGTIAMQPSVLGAVFPFSDMVGFSIVYVLGLLNRRNAATHKRFMLFTGIMMIDPAMARIMFAFELPPPFILLGEFLLLLSVFVYDFKTRNKPHWATVLGSTLFIALLILKLNVQSITWWPNFIGNLF